MPPTRSRIDSSPARSVDSSTTRTSHTTGTTNTASSRNRNGTPKTNERERSKHIEVCVRLRPMVIQKETSGSSFFQVPKRRKPGLPRPNASSRIPGSVRKAVEKLERQEPISTNESSQSSCCSTTSTTPAAVYAWDVVDNDTVTQSPLTDIVAGRTHTYTLDSVYGPDCTTLEVYEQSVRELVHAAMDGYHAAVLAYGQTSTGKTHTMTGTVQEPGFIPLAIRECFQCLRQLQHTNREYLLRISYLEVYKEHIKDLLADSSGTADVAAPPIRLFEQKGELQIKGLREEVVTSSEQVFRILAQGEARRSVGATHLNLHSSRSHVMVRLWIESRAMNKSGKESARASTLSLVDLAGSESVRLTGSSERRSEGHYINQSLMTLGQVVYALSESDDDPAVGGGVSNSGKKHVPYRDSKLTRLLQPSLSGNAQVVLLCCISPLPTHIEESHNTFKFAIRAKKIPQKAVIQDLTDTDEKTLLQMYRDEIEELRKQLREADEQQRLLLQQSVTTSSLAVGTSRNTAEDTEEEMRELMEAISTMEKLILKTGELEETSIRSNELSPTLTKVEQSTSSPAPTTPDHPIHMNGVCGAPIPKDDLQNELSRIQGLLGSVLKKRSNPAIASNEELRILRAQLEQQEVVTSLRQADSSFLLAQLEEKDDLLVEVSKILEAVEERQAALEAENKALREELKKMRIAACSRSLDF